MLTHRVPKATKALKVKREMRATLVLRVSLVPKEKQARQDRRDLRERLVKMDLM